jgi:surfeit locus 1 family protein
LDESVPARTLTITRAGFIGTLVVLAVAGLCVRLAFWQIDRLHQRQERNALLVQRMDARPIPLARVPRDTTGLLYHRVELSGPLDNERTIALAGRSLRGVPGVYVLTPIMLSAQSAVLLNRGWAPSADAATIDFDSLRAQPAARGTAIIVRLPQRQGKPAPAPTVEPPAPSSAAFRRVWFTVDPAALRGQFPYRIADYELQLLPDTNAVATGYPIALPLPATDQGPHLGYAIQWFSFALIALIGWFSIAIRKGEIRRSGGHG